MDIKQIITSAKVPAKDGRKRNHRLDKTFSGVPDHQKLKIPQKGNSIRIRTRIPSKPTNYSFIQGKLNAKKKEVLAMEMMSGPYRKNTRHPKNIGET